MTALLVDRGSWLTVLRRYLGAMALGSLVWEFAQMPFYTLWESGTPGGSHWLPSTAQAATF